MSTALATISHEFDAAETVELGHVPIRPIPLDEIRPSPENSDLYRPVNQDDPDIEALAEFEQAFTPLGFVTLATGRTP